MFLSLIPSKLRHFLDRYQGVLQTSLGVSLILLLASSLGWLQTFEFATFDLMVRLRPASEPDPRIVVLEIEEADIAVLQQWPITDGKLAELLERVAAQQPRFVGLDLYRDLPVGSGQERLAEIIQTMPNLVGVEKAIGESVAAAPLLESLGQVALADVVIDPDSKVRRGLLNVETEPKTHRVGLGVQLALSYLMMEGITPAFSEDEPGVLEIGQTRLHPLKPNSGLYRGVDTGGYQILLDYRGDRTSFERVSVRELLSDRIASDTFTDKIVFIGVSAPSVNDTFLTPYNSGFASETEELPGVYLHAILARQILGAAHGNILIRYWPEVAENLWIVVAAVLGAGGTATVLQRGQRSRQGTPPFWMVLGITSGFGAGLFGIAYIAFLAGWWIPVASPLLALALASVTRVAYQNQVLESLASLDPLTQVANRRRFDQTLQDCLLQSQPTCLILCDVDYFKPFNDTYGHLAGDECLAKVANAIRQSVRRMDLVARYGGEEFAVILPNTHPELAENVAERIRLQVIKLQIEHRNSKVNDYVTLSCGVTSTVASSNTMMPEQLIGAADAALYEAKEKGRNSVVLKLFTVEDVAQEKSASEPSGPDSHDDGIENSEAHSPKGPASPDP